MPNGHGVSGALDGLGLGGQRCCRLTQDGCRRGPLDDGDHRHGERGVARDYPPSSVAVKVGFGDSGRRAATSTETEHRVACRSPVATTSSSCGSVRRSPAPVRSQSPRPVVATSAPDASASADPSTARSRYSRSTRPDASGRGRDDHREVLDRADARRVHERVTRRRPSTRGCDGAIRAARSVAPGARGASRGNGGCRRRTRCGGSSRGRSARRRRRRTPTSSVLRRAEHHHHLVALVDRAAAELGVARRDARDAHHRCLPAQQLFDRGRDRGRDRRRAAGDARDAARGTRTCSRAWP